MPVTNFVRIRNNDNKGANQNKPHWEYDGITHVNVGPFSRCELGRLLNTYSHTPFTHPVLGKFECLSGFIGFVIDPEHNETFKKVWGNSCLRMCVNLKDKLPWEDYDDVISDAVYLKIAQTPGLMDMLMANQLPFESYKVCGDHNGGLVMHQLKLRWYIDHIEKVHSHVTNMVDWVLHPISIANQ